MAEECIKLNFLCLYGGVMSGEIHCALIESHCAKICISHCPVKMS